MFRVSLFLALLAVTGSAFAHQKIPFKLRDNVINVHAVIDGKGVSTALDSGTGALAVSKGLAAKLGLKLTNISAEAAGGGSKKQSLSLIKINSLKLGSLVLSNVSGYALSLHTISSSSGFKIDALLGYPIFRDHVIRINYAKRYVSIYPEDRPLACKSPIHIQIIHNVPVVVAKIKVTPKSEAKKEHLIVDLGSRHYSYLGGDFIKTVIGRELYAKGHKQVVGDGTGGIAKGVVTRLAELDLGQQHFHDVKFALTKQVKAINLKGIEGTLGVPLWNGGVITFDYPNNKMCIETPHK